MRGNEKFLSKCDIFPEEIIWSKSLWSFASNRCWFRTVVLKRTKTRHKVFLYLKKKKSFLLMWILLGCMCPCCSVPLPRLHRGIFWPCALQSTRQQMQTDKRRHICIYLTHTFAAAIRKCANARRQTSRGDASVLHQKKNKTAAHEDVTLSEIDCVSPWHNHKPEKLKSQNHGSVVPLLFLFVPTACKKNVLLVSEVHLVIVQQRGAVGSHRLKTGVNTALLQLLSNSRIFTHTVQC